MQVRTIFGYSCKSHRRLINALVAAISVFGGPAYAQRATENALNAAEDGFGTSIGTETVGLYNSSSARGFNPALAGNIRMEGLYFDQQFLIYGRIYAGTTMRVGLSAQSYPFPAPTGIVDTTLRRPADQPGGGASVIFGPYEAVTIETEVSTPIVPGKLGVLATVSGAQQTHDASYKRAIYGGVLNWTPRDSIDVVAFAQGHAYEGLLSPFIFTVDGKEPPQYDRSVYFGQEWADRVRQANHGGVIVSAKLASDWLLRAGLFRSHHSWPREHFVFFRDVNPDGIGRLDILRSVPANDISDSGEVRLTHTISEGPRRHTFHAAFRGRNVHRRFGGGGLASFGDAAIGFSTPKPRVDFVVTPGNQDHISQASPGLSYVGRWLDYGEVSVGLQKSFYRREVSPFNAAPAQNQSEPWLYNGTMVAYVSDHVAIYGSYSKGLEESGIAPENAANRGEALAASLTEQVDLGLRYKITPRMSLIAGAFEVRKPYFERNAINVFTDVGSLTHKGVELSVSGELAPGLTVVAGAMLLRARVVADQSVANIIAPVPVGRPSRNVRVNLQYGPAAWAGFSINAQVDHDGPAYADRTNTVRVTPNTFLDVGMRYNFKVWDKAASVRAQVQNIGNTFGWNVSSSGSYTAAPPRRYTLQLIADF